MDEFHFALDILKGATPLILAFVAWFLKDMVKTIRKIEVDINDIKTTLATDHERMKNVIEDITEVKQDYSQLNGAFIGFYKKYGNTLEELRER